MPVMPETDLREQLREYVNQSLRTNRQPGETAVQQFRQILAHLVSTDYRGFGAIVIQQLNEYYDGMLEWDALWNTGQRKLSRNPDGSWTLELPMRNLDSLLTDICSETTGFNSGDFIANLMLPWSGFRDSHEDEPDDNDFYDVVAFKRWLDEVGFKYVGS